MITILTVLIFTGAFFAAAEYAWWGPERRLHRGVQKRLRTLRVESGGRRPRSLLREQQLSGVSFIHDLYARLSIMNRLQSIIDQGKLPYRAGNIVTLSVIIFAAAYLAADLLGLFPFAVLRILFAFGCATLPYVYVWMIRQRRMRNIEQMLPDAIDLFTRAMRAGHNIHSGLQVLAEETHDPLAGECRKMVEELALGSTVEEALHNLSDRVPLLDMRFFATAVVLQRETGANIVMVMENLSMVIRERLQLRARLRAHTAQQRFSAGLLCSLPLLTGIVFYVYRYDYISLLWTTPLGSKMLTYLVISEIVGILWVRKVLSVRF
ncbi:MAG: type II secretion system F family protein [Acidobacteria bacterium]|nr:type II secretion system F family protein [Acidobacteriota bacterium]